MYSITLIILHETIIIIYYIFIISCVSARRSHRYVVRKPFLQQRRANNDLIDKREAKSPSSRFKHVSCFTQYLIYSTVDKPDVLCEIRGSGCSKPERGLFTTFCDHIEHFMQECGCLELLHNSLQRLKKYILVLQLLCI